MPEMLNANFKITQEDKRFLEQLVKSGTYKSLSEIYRSAVDDFISKYTNRPTLFSLDQRMQRSFARLDRHDADLREVRAQIFKVEQDVEILKK
ncbi:hypothetical protein KKE60_09070 [Patescibacteria group bacterium]|nr:hypothetical protein [Patescibacteria group bacterium]